MDIQKQIKIQQEEIQNIKDNYNKGHLYFCDKDAYENDLFTARADLKQMLIEMRQSKK
jgi:hypothetical protein